jgi:hypothetical protein
MSYATTTSVFFLIINTENEPHTDLNLYDFLGTKRIENARFFMKLDNHTGESFQEKLNSYFLWLTSVWNDDLFKIASGEMWVTLSFNWGPYK